MTLVIVFNSADWLLNDVYNNENEKQRLYPFIAVKANLFVEQ